MSRYNAKDDTRWAKNDQYYLNLSKILAVFLILNSAYAIACSCRQQLKILYTRSIDGLAVAA